MLKKILLKEMHTSCSYNKALTILPYFVLLVAVLFFFDIYLVANTMKTLGARYGGVQDWNCAAVKSFFFQKSQGSYTRR